MILSLVNVLNRLCIHTDYFANWTWGHVNVVHDGVSACFIIVLSETVLAHHHMAAIVVYHARRCTHTYFTLLFLIIFIQFLLLFILTSFFLCQFCLFCLFCVWFYSFWRRTSGIDTLRIFGIEGSACLTVVKFQLSLTLWTILLSSITSIKIIKIDRILADITTDNKVIFFTLPIRTTPHRPKWNLSKVEIRRCTKWAWTILEPLPTILTLIKLAIVKFVISSRPATFRTRHILLIRLAMSTLNPLS